MYCEKFKKNITAVRGRFVNENKFDNSCGQFQEQSLQKCIDGFEDGFNANANIVTNT
jgi:hypothetical protein